MTSQKKKLILTEIQKHKNFTFQLLIDKVIIEKRGAAALHTQNPPPVKAKEDPSYLSDVCHFTFPTTWNLISKFILINCLPYYSRNALVPVTQRARADR